MRPLRTLQCDEERVVVVVSRYNFSNVEDGKWGHIEAGPSGKEWNGMVGQVSSAGDLMVSSSLHQAAWGDVDFVICDMFLTFIRL